MLRCYLVQQEIQEEVEEDLDFHFRVAEFPHAGGDVQLTGV